MLDRITRRSLLIGGVAATLTLAGGTAAVAATPTHAMPGTWTCRGGTWNDPALVPSGTYHNLVVRGICSVPNGATVRVRHNLEVEQHGAFVAISSATVWIHGDAVAERNGILALGCTPELGCSTPAVQVVRGDVRARGARAVYLNGVVVDHDVAIRGGGPGVHCVDNGFPPLGHDLPLKDNTIGGNVHVTDWAGCWAGLLRNTVGGSVVYSRNKANLAVDSAGQPVNPQGPDSNEIVANRIKGNLTCYRNNPMPQYGDAGGPPYATNVVGGHKRGQCAGL